MVIGTGDMSELALGWATYNGDHMSMYGVNASVPKTLVRHLVRYYADICDDSELKGIFLDVLDTPVSPELLPPQEDGTIAQKTEDLVGPYELHDFFMYHILRFGVSPAEAFQNCHDVHLKVNLKIRKYISGFAHLYGDFLHSSLSVHVFLTDLKSEALQFRQEAI